MIRELKTYDTESREALQEMLSRLQDEARQRTKDLRRGQEQDSGSGSPDEMNLGNTTGAIETHRGLIALAEEKLKHLDEAMMRLRAGKYGRCLNCGGAISIERLMAIPFASYCADCQKQLNRVKGGWGHAPYDDQWTVPEQFRRDPLPNN